MYILMYCHNRDMICLGCYETLIAAQDAMTTDFNCVLFEKNPPSVIDKLLYDGELSNFEAWLNADDDNVFDWKIIEIGEQIWK